MSSNACSPEVFKSLCLSSINVQAVTATPVVGYPVVPLSIPIPNHGDFGPTTADFCNVTVTYTQVGEDENPIIFEAWLPSHGDWNKRIMGTGGSEFAMGRYPGGYAHMAGVVSEGFAAFTSDGGAPDPTGLLFALKEPGVLDEVLLRTWSTEAINDMARLGKAVSKIYYQEAAAYSYFAGCSQGGRHGYEAAQRYPDAYDGIAAAAPVIKQVDAASYILWPQIAMYQANVFPRSCEIDSITQYAIEACDAKDGIEDGVIMDPDVCDPINPLDYVDKPAIKCADQTSLISDIAALVVNASWTGLIEDTTGELLYPGLLPGADLTGYTDGLGIAGTTCYDTGEDCAANPATIAIATVRVYILKDAKADPSTVTPEILFEARRQGSAIIDELDTYNPDLTKFRDKGGKMITFHGLADQVIATPNVRRYYNLASDRVSDIGDFYRYFEIPGLAHCFGPQHPDGTFKALQAWVEDGIVPETLTYKQADAKGVEGERLACAYPKVARFDKACGDPNEKGCFVCE